MEHYDPVHPHFCRGGSATLQIGAVVCHAAPALSYRHGEVYHVWSADGDGDAHGHLPAPLRLSGPTAVYLDGACVGHVDAAGASAHDPSILIRPTFADGTLTALSVGVARARPEPRYHCVRPGKIVDRAVVDGMIISYGQPDNDEEGALRALSVLGRGDPAAWWAVHGPAHDVKIQP